MAKHTKAIRQTVFAVPVAALATAAVWAPAARAADECLAAPNGKAPQGSHWYYRSDHAAKRKCWYLGQEGQKVRQAAKKPHASASEAPAAEESAGGAGAAEPPVPAAQAEVPRGDPREWGTGDPAPYLGAAAQHGHAAQTAAPGNQDEDPQATSATAPWPQPATAATTTGRANAGAADAGTPTRALVEPATGAAVEHDDQDASATPAAAKARSAPSDFGWMLWKIGGAVSIGGLLVYLAFRIPAGRMTRAVGQRRTDRTVDQVDETLAPTLAPDHQTAFPRLRTREDTSDPRRNLRQVLQALERASSDRPGIDDVMVAALPKDKPSPRMPRGREGIGGTGF